MTLMIYTHRPQPESRPDPDPPMRLVCAGDPLDSGSHPDHRLTLCDQRRSEAFKVEDDLGKFRWFDRSFGTACQGCLRELQRRWGVELADPTLPPPWHGPRSRGGRRG